MTFFAFLVVGLYLLGKNLQTNSGLKQIQNGATK